MLKFVRGNLMWCLGLAAVAALVGGAAVAQIAPLTDGPTASPARRPPLITPIRPPFISPYRPAGGS
jgi:hypothetical protein